MPDFRKVPVSLATRTRSSMLLVGVAVLAAFAVALPLAGAGNNQSVSLRVWAIDSGPKNDILNALVRRYERSHPGTKVKVSYFSYDDIGVKGKLAVSGSNPPDTLQLALSQAVIGQLVRAKRILNLDSYAVKYGWLERFPAASLINHRYDKKGNPWGGNLYGPPQVIEPVGVYYNKSKLKALGLKVPSSFNDFVKALPVAKSAGEVPVVIGDLDKWPAGHLYGVIQQQYTPKQVLRDFSYKASTTGTFKHPGNLTAAAVLQAWSKKGFLSPDPNSLSYDDAGKNFVNGTGVFYPAGTWLAQQFKEGMRNNVGFFVMPPRKNHKGYSVMSSPDFPWSVPTRGKHHDETVALIDFLTNSASGTQYAKSGFLPAMKGVKIPKTTGVTKDTLAAAAVISRDDAAVPYWGGETPAMGDVVGAAFQELLALRITPTEFATRIEDELQKAK